MAKKYEVTIDGDTEEVSTKKEATELLVEAALDGDEHEVAVEVVDTKAADAEEGPEEVSNPDNPTAVSSVADGGTADAQGIVHVR
jgi:hypothetical protein